MSGGIENFGTHMQNPWIHLPSSAPYALPSDLHALQAFNAVASANYRYDLSLFPEPFFGGASANVIVLTLNPGLHLRDAETHAEPAFARQARDSLTHQLFPYPFLHLQPNSDSTGNLWWRRRARELIEEVGFELVAKGLSCVQYMPYHSSEYSKNSPHLPSQAYSFNLIRSGIQRGAEIVIMRSRDRWERAVPELHGYQHLHFAKNPRSPYLSLGNLGVSFAVIAARLRRDA
jgi:hypothetical protein